MTSILETTFSNVFSLQPFWKNHWGLFLKAKLIMDQYRSSRGLVTLSVPSQYLHRWWLSSLTHICITYASPSLNAIYIIYQVIYMWICYSVVKTILVYPYDLFTHNMGEICQYHTKIKHQNITGRVPFLHGVVYILFIRAPTTKFIGVYIANKLNWRTQISCVGEGDGCKGNWSFNSSSQIFQ